MRLLSILYRPLVVYPLGDVLMWSIGRYLGWWIVAVIIAGGIVDTMVCAWLVMRSWP